jgi:hypothetical protein
VSRRSSGRHRRRSRLSRAAPAVATAAGGVALVTVIAAGADWLAPDGRGPGVGSDRAGNEPDALIPPTISTVPTAQESPPEESPDPSRAASPGTTDDAGTTGARDGATAEDGAAVGGTQAGVQARTQEAAPAPRTSRSARPSSSRPRSGTTSPPPQGGGDQLPDLPVSTPPPLLTPLLSATSGVTLGG